MNKAHGHAESAESYRANGLLVSASEEHAKAATAYLAAVERSEDEQARINCFHDVYIIDGSSHQAKRTLKMLHDDQVKAVKELDKRIEMLRKEGKDPTLPQKSNLPKQGTTRHLVEIARSIPSSPNQHQSLNELQGTVDESFMLLGGQRSDPGDAFNHFWDIMQGMLDNLSQPVAFATVPLDAESSAPSPPVPRARESPSAPEPEETLASRFSKKLGFSSSTNKTTQAPPQEDFDEDFADDGQESPAMTCLDHSVLIPSDSEPSLQTLKKENTTLKAELENLKKRLETTERVLQRRKEQDVQLRDSIYGNEGGAQRAIGGPGQRPGMDLGSLNLHAAPSVPIPGFNTAREAQYAKKVQELQDELSLMRNELERTRLDNVKHRERWAKVKESAKRKKETKAAEAAKASRIVEEPEVEEAEDRA
ncbi:hypothetical protein C8J56DRAFT_956080 [Mycena floridula]|nr:hypothetical protein C8J56DRAFT_956080 [Mycena floridula]